MLKPIIAMSMSFDKAKVISSRPQMAQLSIMKFYPKLFLDTYDDVYARI